jgi:hypothetical protein
MVPHVGTSCHCRHPVVALPNQPDVETVAGILRVCILQKIQGLESKSITTARFRARGICEAGRVVEDSFSSAYFTVILVLSKRKKMQRRERVNKQKWCLQDVGEVGVELAESRCLSRPRSMTRLARKKVRCGYWEETQNQIMGYADTKPDAPSTGRKSW